MIVKELDHFTSQDVLARAGRAAEEQLAHYLRRAFADDEEILVFNGIRLEHEGDAAQMDHLILHPHGMMIIESKSVTGKVRINEHGEWSRFFGQTARGMPSPLLQAERQADFLRAYLQRHPRVLASKELAVNVRVAISDAGIIERARGVELERVCKADQMPEEIQTTIQARGRMQAMPRVMARVLSSATGFATGAPLTVDDRERVRQFLLDHHRALAPKTAAPSPAVAPMPARQPVAAGRQAPTRQATPIASDADQAPINAPCPACCGTHLTVAYRFNYYFNCLDCHKNSPIQRQCHTCHAPYKVRKAGARFFLDCATCGSSSWFHTNPVGS